MNDRTENKVNMGTTSSAPSVQPARGKTGSGGEIEAHPHQAWLDEIDAVRAWIVDNPDVPLSRMYIFPQQDRSWVGPDNVAKVRAEYAATAKALLRTGRVEKTESGTERFPMAGLKVAITENTDYEWNTPRDSICSKQTVTKEVEEWVCEPVLAGAES